MARKSRKKCSASDIMEQKIYKTAIYARLSREAQKTEKIEAQINEVKQYIAKRPYFQLIDVYADNGYSGTNFQRPEFERLMEDLRNKKIDCIIVKDLSRFAREYIGAGDYLNNIFPFLGVRFIAINDSYDNINIEPQEYFLASFKNIAHAHFAAETSRKVSASKRALQEQGKFVGNRAAFGYKIDPNDCHKLLVDEKQAAVVREIFTRVADGEKISNICKDLKDRNVLDKSCKIYYQILKNEIYIGKLIQRKKMTSFYKNEGMRLVPKDEQICIENGVPAIISRELWQKANNAIAERERKRHEGIPDNPYKSLMYCGKCEKKLSGGFNRKKNDFTFSCAKCRNGVYTRGKYIKEAVGEYLGTPITELTSEFLGNSFDKILVFALTDITFIEKGGAEK